MISNVHSPVRGMPAGYQRHPSTHIAHFFMANFKISACNRETRTSDGPVIADARDHFVCGHCTKALKKSEVKPADALVPDNIKIIYYDIRNKMALALQERTLVGFYEVENGDSDYAYEWDNGFDFEHISIDQAATLRIAGYGSIVDYFESRGGVCKGWTCKD